MDRGDRRWDGGHGATWAEDATPVRLGSDALVKALGWVNAVRFLQQYETSRLDYTRERDQSLPEWDADWSCF